jgi:hypothetical protein
MNVEIGDLRSPTPTIELAGRMSTSDSNRESVIREMQEVFEVFPDGTVIKNTDVFAYANTGPIPNSSIDDVYIRIGSQIPEARAKRQAGYQLTEVSFQPGNSGVTFTKGDELGDDVVVTKPDGTKVLVNREELENINFVTSPRRVADLIENGRPYVESVDDTSEFFGGFRDKMKTIFAVESEEKKSNAIKEIFSHIISAVSAQEDDGLERRATFKTTGQGTVFFPIEYGKYKVTLDEYGTEFELSYFVDGKRVLVPVNLPEDILENGIQVPDRTSRIEVQEYDTDGSFLELELFVDRNDNGIWDGDEPPYRISNTSISLTRLEEGSVDIDLVEGWNMVQIDSKLDGVTAGDMLEFITEQDGYATVVSKYENGRWVSYVRRAGGIYSTLDFNIKPGETYYIKVLTSTKLTLPKKS